MADVYGVSSFEVNMCSIIYMIAFIIVVFPANYILDKYGLKVGVLLGSAFTLAGSIMRLGAYMDFW